MEANYATLTSSARDIWSATSFMGTWPSGGQTVDDPRSYSSRSYHSRSSPPCPVHVRRYTRRADEDRLFTLAVCPSDSADDERVVASDRNRAYAPRKIRSGKQDIHPGGFGMRVGRDAQ